MAVGQDGAVLLLRQELLMERLRRPQAVALLEEMAPCRPSRLAGQGRLLLHQLGHLLMSLGQRLEGYAGAPLAAGKH
jgi:hypothetical protein